MEKVDITIPLSTSLKLADIVNSILYTEIVKDGKVIGYEERKLPFRLSYRLARAKTILDRDVKLFYNKKMMLTAQYGELSEDGSQVEIKDPEKMKLFQDSISAALGTMVTRNIIKCEPEDLDEITDHLDITTEALEVFIAYMTADEEFLKDFKAQIILDEANTENN